jgi:hypothetical protein
MSWDNKKSVLVYFPSGERVDTIFLSLLSQQQELIVRVKL